MDSRLAAILDLARRYDYDAGHAHQVECLAGTLFMELEPLHNLTREDRKLLELAAIVHDIGYFYSAKGHHRNALQMLLTEPIADLPLEEKKVIANLARYHRKAGPSMDHTAYRILSEEDRRRVDLMAPILRLADALDRSHEGAVLELFCDIREDSVTIYAGANRELPVEAAAIERKGDLFRQVYRRDIRLTVLRPRLPESSTSGADFQFEASR